MEACLSTKITWMTSNGMTSGTMKMLIPSSGRHRKGSTMDDNEITEGNSETGITLGLIEGMIASTRVLAGRDLSSAEVNEALNDLRGALNLLGEALNA
jgi:hypothetical protein